VEVNNTDSEVAMQNAQVNQPHPEQQKVESPIQKGKPAKKRKRKRHIGITLLRLVIALIVIAVGIYLILYIVAYAARYESIGAMLEHMNIELSLMWQRIRN